jgi:hypothetical protein
VLAHVMRSLSAGDGPGSRAKQDNIRKMPKRNNNQMKVCVTADLPGWPRLLVLVVVIVVMAIATVRGYTAGDVITVLLGAALAGSPLAARAKSRGLAL